MRKILIAGNWKMNGSLMMIRKLLDGIIQGAGDNPAAELAVFPPFPYLSMVRAMAANTPVAWGAQTLNPNSAGAHTGEVSADMLLDLDCHYVLVGHSERRESYGESDGDVADRFATAHAAGLVPVLCVGESLAERENGETEAVVARQLDAVIATNGIDAFSRAVIAYEPVWAIGTGLTATPEQAQSVHAFIRNKLTALDGTIAARIKILYGGSVNGSNAADLFAREDIDGGLVGGASLTARDFLNILEAVG